jgi:uncharacterized damage-inducible protein DinB
MEPQQSQRDTAEILKALHDSRAEFLAAADVPEEKAKMRPAPDRWSVIDCVEHIVIAEGRFLGWLENQEGLPVPPADREKEAKLLAGVASRATRVQAPEAARPTGRFATLADALDEFDTIRARSIAFAEKQGAGLYTLAAKHSFFGPVNGAEVVCLMAAHSRRHAAQIHEIRGAL